MGKSTVSSPAFPNRGNEPDCNAQISGISLFLRFRMLFFRSIVDKRPLIPYGSPQVK